MKSLEEKLLDVNPGSIVLMFNNISIGLIIGKYKFSSFSSVKRYEYHVIWVYPSGQICSITTWDLKSLIADVISY